MGRKAIDKERKELIVKINNWLKALDIKLQTANVATLTIDNLTQLSGKIKATLYLLNTNK